MPEIILARVLRCRFCEREMGLSPLEYEENPFCRICLKRRMKEATPPGEVQWSRLGNYFTARVSRRRHPGARRHHQG